jgi:hypothetical protein
VLEQELDDGLTPVGGGVAQRRPNVPILRVGVGLVLEQQLDDGLAPVSSGIT